jgi:hypothetical protein
MFSILRVLSALSLILLAFPVLAQDAMTPAELLEAEEEKRNEIIFYVASGLGVVAMIAGAWILGNGKSKKTESASPANTTPGMRISAGRTNDPYMRRKVVKRTS